jgi:general secretion pathway protein M
MNFNLTPLQHNIASTGILLTVLTVVFGVLVLPGWAEYSQNAEHLASLQDRLKRYDRLRDQKDQLQKQIAALTQTDAVDSEAFVPGNSPALAAAELQQYLKAMVEAIGARVISTQALPVDESGSFPRITIKVQLKGDIVALHQLFFQIETGAPAAYLDKLLIQSQRSRTRRRRSQAPTPVVQEVDVRFELSSYSAGF